MNINEELNKLPIWKDKCCVYCGRKYPNTILNIEGVIHYHAEIACLDKKACNKKRKRAK